jgi:hypothetical protein
MLAAEWMVIPPFKGIRRLLVRRVVGFEKVLQELLDI